MSGLTALLVRLLVIY